MTKRRIPRTELERFEARVYPEPNSGCWLFMSTHEPGGYGRFCFNKTVRFAHRAAYEIYVGPIPDGMVVCHKCDVPACVNPDHLFIGTQFDNLRDMASKGRRYKPEWRGETHPRSKLTDEIVQAIRAERAATGLSFSELGKKYGVVHSTIAVVIRGEGWRHLLENGNV